MMTTTTTSWLGRLWVITRMTTVAKILTNPGFLRLFEGRHIHILRGRNVGRTDSSVTSRFVDAQSRNRRTLGLTKNAYLLGSRRHALGKVQGEWLRLGGHRRCHRRARNLFGRRRVHASTNRSLFGYGRSRFHRARRSGHRTRPPKRASQPHCCRFRVENSLQAKGGQVRGSELVKCHAGAGDLP